MCEVLQSAATIVTEPRVSYEGFITIMLTALGVAVAVLAVALAVAAFFGYRVMVDEVIKQAKEAASRVTLEAVEEKAIAAARSVASKVAEKALEKMDLGVLLSAAQSEGMKYTSKLSEPVGQDYPGEGANYGNGKSGISGGDNSPSPASASS